MERIEHLAKARINLLAARKHLVDYLETFNPELDITRSIINDDFIIPIDNLITEVNQQKSFYLKELP